MQSVDSQNYSFSGMPVRAKCFTTPTSEHCKNLNADLLDGKHAADFVSKETFDAIVARVSALESKNGG